MVVALLVAQGCVVSADESDSEQATESSSPDPSATTPEPTSTSLTDTDSDTEQPPLPEGCSENLLLDPGFEGGSRSSAWEQASTLFGTPICDAACTDDEGASPLAGNWWVWFGGIDQMDTASVAQTVVFPEGTGVLRFGFQINASSGSGTDVFAVEIDGDTVFMATDAQLAQYAAWSSVEVDVTTFANGGEHVIRFAAVLSGAGVSNFFLDDTLLVSCSEATSSSTGGSSSSSTAADNTGSSSTTESAGDSGSSEAGGTTDADPSSSTTGSAGDASAG